MSSQSSITPKSTVRARVRVSAAPSLPQTIDTERRFYQATMSPDKFGEFITHPRQRDTERHAITAQKRHLKDFNITQANVSAAHWDGKYYKLDGHTRSMLWSNGTLSKPDKVTVTIYNCSTYDELLDLYSTFDNKYAAENGTDQLSGAMREAGITVTSQMFRNYKFLSAIKRAWAAAQPNRGHYGDAATPALLLRQVRFFANEIKLLDSIDPNPRLFRLGVAAGAFLALKRYGESVLPFFRALNENKGVQGDGNCDAVQALHNLIISTRFNTHRDAFSMMSRTLSCVETWRRGRFYQLSRLGVAVVKHTDVAEFVKAITKGQGAEATPTEDAKPAVPSRAAIEVVLPTSL